MSNAIQGRDLGEGVGSAALFGGVTGGIIGTGVASRQVDNVDQYCSFSADILVQGTMMMAK